jgi:hypothetical protein
MPRSRCFYISTQVWVVCCWSHCFVTKPGRMLIRSILLVMQVSFIFGGPQCTSSRIYHKERRTRIRQSPMKPMTKVSSVRQINLSYENSSCLEDYSSRDCEYAIDDLCPRSNEWRRHTHPNPRWCIPRLNWRLMRTFTDLSYEKLDRIPCRLNTLHRAAVRIHQSKCIACSQEHGSQGDREPPDYL